MYEVSFLINEKNDCSHLGVKNHAINRAKLVSSLKTIFNTVLTISNHSSVMAFQIISLSN